MKNLITNIETAYTKLLPVVTHTPLQYNERLSKKYKANVYLKREDLQKVRSYKLRGAYNKMLELSEAERKKGIVCASAGNHAQGVAFCAKKLKTKAYIYMPKGTPRQKINRVRYFGDRYVEIVLKGKTFDEASVEAVRFCNEKNMSFVHPFDDLSVIAGQGTVGVEILNDIEKEPDVIVLPVGGGGLISGVGSYIKNRVPRVKVVSVEPEGAPSFKKSLKKGKIIKLETIDKFVDGAAVKRIGKNNFAIAKKIVDESILVNEDHLCSVMIDLFQNDGIITEPAGALSIAALDNLKKKIKGKTVVCVVSGGNNDMSRYSEIMERSMVHQGLKYYFIISLPQKPGALRALLEKVLGSDDDITLFEYTKKNNRESGPILIGIELADRKDYKPLITRMKKEDVKYEEIDRSSELFSFIV